MRKKKRCKCRRRRNPQLTQRTNFAALKNRVRKTRNGRKVWSIAKRFWKLKEPVAITRVKLPNRFKSDVPVAFLGQAPALTVADGPKESATKKRRMTLPKSSVLVGDHSGKRMAILNLKRGIPEKPKLKKLGYAAATEYVSSKDIRKAGSPKGKDRKGRTVLWQHSHSEEGGKYPEVIQDQNGNIGYRNGTYSFNGLWMRK